MSTNVKVDVVDNDLEGLISQLALAEQELSAASELFIDTSTYPSARPHTLTALTAFMKDVQIKFPTLKRISMKLPRNKNVRNNMARIKFYQENGFDVTYPYTVNASTGRFVEIKCFNAGNIDEVVEELTQVIRQAELTDGLQKALAFCLSEIIDNSCCHAQVPTGIICAQAFLDRIEVSIVDRGVGVASSLKEVSQFKNLSSRELLEHSIKEGVTSKEKSERGHQGFGLFSVNEIAKLSGGSFNIYSYDSRLETRGGGTSSFDSPPWSGTIINLVLKKNIPPHKWEEIWRELFWSRSFPEPLLSHIDDDDFF